MYTSLVVSFHRLSKNMNIIFISTTSKKLEPLKYEIICDACMFAGIFVGVEFDFTAECLTSYLVRQTHGLKPGVELFSALIYNIFRSKHDINFNVCTAVPAPELI